MNGQARTKADEGPCRLCGTFKNLTAHHLVPESWFRRHPPKKGYVRQDCRHSVSNIVSLCKGCHRLIDGHRKTLSARHAQTRQARSRLRGLLSEAELLFVVRIRGTQWLDHHYPKNFAYHDVKRDGTNLVFI